MKDFFSERTKFISLWDSLITNKICLIHHTLRSHKNLKFRSNSKKFEKYIFQSKICFKIFSPKVYKRLKIRNRIYVFKFSCCITITAYLVGFFLRPDDRLTRQVLTDRSILSSFAIGRVATSLFILLIWIKPPEMSSCHPRKHLVTSTL